MNKYEVILDMLKNKILFVFERCEHDDNKISITKDLLFLSIIPFVIIIRPLKLIVKNESDEDSFDMNYSKDISNRKRLISIFRALKEKMIKESDLIDIVEIGVLVYYHLARNKKSKLFSLTINKIYDTLCEFFLVRII